MLVFLCRVHRMLQARSWNKKSQFPNHGGLLAPSSVGAALIDNADKTVTTMKEFEKLYGATGAEHFTDLHIYLIAVALNVTVEIRNDEGICMFHFVFGVVVVTCPPNHMRHK